MIKARNKLFACRKRQLENDCVTEVFKKFRNKINGEITKSKKYYLQIILRIVLTMSRKHGKE